MLEVKDLVFHPLDNGVEKSIIENISFTVNDGEMLVITGPNGGGKSTVAKLLMGIEPLDAGRIFLDGTDITEYSIAQQDYKMALETARKLVGYLEQIETEEVSE